MKMKLVGITFKVLLSAGLLFFTAAGRSEEAEGQAPARQVIRETPTPVILVKPADLEKLSLEIRQLQDDQTIQRQENQDLQKQLIQNLDEVNARLKLQQENASAFKQKLETENFKEFQEIRQRGQDIQERLKALEKTLDSTVAQEEKQNDDLAAYGANLQAFRSRMEAALAEMKTLQQDIEKRGQRLGGMADLLSVMKKDLNDVSQEVVEIKQDIRDVTASLNSPAQSLPWWEQTLRWKYFPATATLLSVIAVGLAAAP